MKKYKNVLVMKFDFELESFETALSLRKQTADALDEDFYILIVPTVWEVKLLKEDIIFIKMDMSIDLDVSQAFFDENRKYIGEEYKMVANILDAEVIL